MAEETFITDVCAHGNSDQDKMSKFNLLKGIPSEKYVNKHIRIDEAQKSENAIKPYFHKHEIELKRLKCKSPSGS